MVQVEPPSQQANLALSPDGSFTYTPGPGFFGPVNFTYTANDVGRSSNAAKVSIEVRDATPPVVTLTILTVPNPNGLAGYFVTPVTVKVEATDASNVSSLTCNDNGSDIVPSGGFDGIRTPTASGNLSVSAEGPHVLVCTATDSAGNDGSASRTVKIDTVAPVTVINSGPASDSEITTASATFGFSGTDATSGPASFECRLDSPTGAFSASACTDITTTLTGSTTLTGTTTLAGLSIGSHTFDVRAKDNAGNVDASPASRTFKVVYTVTPRPVLVKTSAQLGSAVPVVFQVKNPLGVVITSTGVVDRIYSVHSPLPSSGVCPAASVGITTTEVLYEEPNFSTGKSSLRFITTTQSFQFNWDTTSASTEPLLTGKGCYTVLIYLDDQSAARRTTPVQLK